MLDDRIVNTAHLPDLCLYYAQNTDISENEYCENGEIKTSTTFDSIEDIFLTKNPAQER